MQYTTQYTIGEICEILGVSLPIPYRHLANEIATNMSYSPNFVTEGSAFFLSINASREEQNERLAKAIEEKASIIFVDKTSRSLPRLGKIPHVVLKGTPFSAVIKLSATIREKLGLHVVGITGSLGKTTTKDIVHAVLKQRYTAEKSPGNQNTIYPLFNNLQKLPLNTEFFVQEFGAARPGTMPKTARACMPDAGIITNISDPHLDLFGTRENILQEKLKLITQMPAGCPAFLNYDDELLKEVRLENRPIISYAVENREADYYADNLVVEAEYMTFDIVHGDRRTPVRLNAFGAHNVGNALVAAAVGEWFGMSQEDIVKGIAEYRSSGFRQTLTNIGGYNLFIDCYNTAPVSLLGAVDVIGRFPVEKGGKRIAVIGDIARLGSKAEELHIDTGRKIGTSGKLDLALCFGNENAELMANAIRQAGTAALYTPNRQELNYWISSLVTKKDIVLFKGPVARLLSRSIDQVFGTSYHVSSEHYEFVTRNEFRMKKIYEKEDHDRKMTAIFSYEGRAENLTLPNQCDGIDIFCVGDKCFFQNASLRSVVIPAPIFNIAAEAFRNCTALKEVSLPGTLKVIECSCFQNCTALSEIVLPDSLIDIGQTAFANCASLRKVLIPGSVGNIGKDAFSGCNKLTIHCSEGSYAQKYAQDNNIPFVLV